MAYSVGRTVQTGNDSENWRWEYYTDHQPVEITVRVGYLWVPQGFAEGGGIAGVGKPNLARLAGNTEGAKNDRKLWAERVEERLGGERDTEI
eukprot:1808751-Heterocapsa_arctica.AAC.1